VDCMVIPRVSVKMFPSNLIQFPFLRNKSMWPRIITHEQKTKEFRFPTNESDAGISVLSKLLSSEL